MLIKIINHEAHLFGTPADFNNISRGIRKCKLGQTLRLPLEKNQSRYTSLDICCTAQTASFFTIGDTFFITFPQSIRRHLHPYFSMPAETQAGSTFFINKSQIEQLNTLSDSSLGVVIHVDLEENLAACTLTLG